MARVWGGLRPYSSLPDCIATQACLQSLPIPTAHYDQIRVPSRCGSARGQEEAQRGQRWCHMVPPWLWSHLLVSQFLWGRSQSSECILVLARIVLLPMTPHSYMLLAPHRHATPTHTAPSAHLHLSTGSESTHEPKSAAVTKTPYHVAPRRPDQRLQVYYSLPQLLWQCFILLFHFIPPWTEFWHLPLANYQVRMTITWIRSSFVSHKRCFSQLPRKSGHCPAVDATVARIKLWSQSKERMNCPRMSRPWSMNLSREWNRHINGPKTTESASAYSYTIDCVIPGQTTLSLMWLRQRVQQCRGLYEESVSERNCVLFGNFCSMDG